MTDFPSDDARLRATETQMRHALGLHGGAPTRSSAGGSQPQRRRFVRDGEVPVTIIHGGHHPDGEAGTNQLDAARQAVRCEAAARERAQRLLEEAQATIRDLQTKLGHERLAKDEALETVLRLETETRVAEQAQQAAEPELVAERLARRNAEDALAEALGASQEADGRLGQVIARQQVQNPPQAPHGLTDATRTKQTVPASLDMGAEPDANDTARPTIPVRVRKRRIGAGATDTSTAKSDRGQPASDGKHDPDIVEWWEPGWQERFR
jgi:hypothetical protein